MKSESNESEAMGEKSHAFNNPDERHTSPAVTRKFRQCWYLLDKLYEDISESYILGGRSNNSLPLKGNSYRDALFLLDQAIKNLEECKVVIGRDVSKRRARPGGNPKLMADLQNAQVQINTEEVLTMFRDAGFGFVDYRTFIANRFKWGFCPSKGRHPILFGRNDVRRWLGDKHNQRMLYEWEAKHADYV